MRCFVKKTPGSVFVLAALVTIVIFTGCPLQKTGYLISINADISRQESYEFIRKAILSTGHFEGPLNVETGSGLCEGAIYYRKVLPNSRVTLIFHDCYRASQHSETGWVYTATLSGRREVLAVDVKKEMEIAAEELKDVIQRAVPTAKVTVRAMDTGYGFSLLPH